MKPATAAACAAPISGSYNESGKRVRHRPRGAPRCRGNSAKVQQGRRSRSATAEGAAALRQSPGAWARDRRVRRKPALAADREAADPTDRPQKRPTFGAGSPWILTALSDWFFMVLLYCIAVARAALCANSRFGAFNSRLGAKKFPFSRPRELARKGLICLAIFCTETALFGWNRKNSRFYGNKRDAGGSSPPWPVTKSTILSTPAPLLRLVKTKRSGVAHPACVAIHDLEAGANHWRKRSRHHASARRRFCRHARPPKQMHETGPAATLAKADFGSALGQ